MVLHLVYMPGEGERAPLALAGFGGEQSLAGGRHHGEQIFHVESYAKNKSRSSEKYAILGSCTLIFPVGNCIE